MERIDGLKPGLRLRWPPQRVEAEVALYSTLHAPELNAVLIVMAVVDLPRHTNPYVGAQTLRVLEFSEVPILVVPAPSDQAR